MVHRFISCFTAILFLLFGAARLEAQNKQLDHSVYDGWQSVTAVRLSPDGQILSYVVTPQEGDATLYIRDLKSGKVEAIERGGSLKWAQDARYGIFTVKAPFAETRQAKIDKKKKDEQPKDSLAKIDLRTFAWEMIGSAGTTDLGYDAAPYLFAAQDVKERESKNLLVINTASGAVDTLRNVSRFKASKSGDRLLVVTAKEEKDSLSCSAVILYDLAKGSIDTLSSGRKAYNGLAFNDGGDKLAFLATDQEEKKDGTPAYALYAAQEQILKKATRRNAAVTKWNCAEVLAGDSPELPEGWVIDAGADPKISNRSSRLFFSLSPYYPAKDTTVYDFEAAQLDIWVWDNPVVPPMNKVQGGGRPRTRSAVLALNRPGQLLIVAASPSERISVLDGGEAPHAIVTSTERYDMDNLWAADSRADVSIVNLQNGTRTLVGEGIQGISSPSPHGKYICHFNPEDGNWYCYDIASGVKVNLTGSTGVNFWDEEDDHPLPGYTPVGRPVWGGNDEFLLLTDRYDVWKFSPDARKVECLTRGEGRRNRIEYQPEQLGTVSNPYLYQNINTLPTKGRITLSSFDEVTKRNGYASVDIARPAEPQGFLAEKSFTQVTKAEQADVIAYLKGDFRHPMDLHVTRDGWKTEEKLTAINLQQAEYRWGSVQLVHWKAYDGTPLDGLLFTPDGMVAGEKLPMMIYFYEKNAETLFNYRAPAPSRSTVNIPFFVSRGYVVFVPDIVYQDGHPGESAYNCVCSGAEAMCEQFPYIDKARMAIQGQSWGGYQTAYLITRTNMFAAAGAGAPVGNMTSAYGGIRWESGIGRIPQYEHGQSRIGKTLWEDGGLDLYIENSPVFFAPNVTTPVLIMHNDNDGAVPWYQGIEMFMGLRRLGKPAWLLEYNDEAHNLKQRRNRKDLSIRLQQFFDYYLKGEPEPAWMRDGVPTAKKGYYFGYEY